MKGSNRLYTYKNGLNQVQLIRYFSNRALNRSTTEYISGHTHPVNGTDSVFLSNNGWRLQNIAMA